LARTSTESKHRGLTTFLVPMRSPGVEIRAIHTLGGERTNATFYNEVWIPDSARIGAVDGGWDVMRVALAFERQPAFVAALAETMDEALQHLGSATVTVDRADHEFIGRLATRLEISRLLGEAVANIQAAGDVPVVEGSISKLYSTEALVWATEQLVDRLGIKGVTAGRAEELFRHAPVTTIYAGSSEVQRGVIAERGLGLPRPRPI
jgi:alkylation response protein AidB-like acyl-CoA dehydrogenase